MSSQAHKAAEWIYRGIWGVLAGLFRVPQHPPALPVASGTRHESFQPGEGYLRYLKFKFWVVLALIDGVLILLSLIAAIGLMQADHPEWILVLLVPELILIVVPDIIAYVAIHLRYDTMWYVLTDRSLRIRRGIWIIHEITITFENVQNVTVQQGPLERWFGIASVVVDTAGGGGASHPHQAGLTHRGVLEGIGNAQEIRDLILSRVRASTSAGLGDERHGAGAHGVGAQGASACRAGDGRGESARGPAFTAEHVAALRAIRDELRGMRALSAN